MLFSSISKYYFLLVFCNNEIITWLLHKKHFGKTYEESCHVLWIASFHELLCQQIVPVYITASQYQLLCKTTTSLNSLQVLHMPFFSMKIVKYYFFHNVRIYWKISLKIANQMIDPFTFVMYHFMLCITITYLS